MGIKPYEAQKIANVDNLAALFKEGNLTTAEGPLRELKRKCIAVMDEVKEIAKEVGGDPRQSQRFQYNEAILEHLRALERITNGQYHFVAAVRDSDMPSKGVL